jgi:di-heme cytochrome c peroxidase family protein
MTRRISAPSALRRLSHFLPALLLAACTLAPHCDRSRADCLRQVYSLPPRYWPAAQVDAGVAFSELAPLPRQPEKPVADAKVALGKKLFNEKRLSSDGTVACASCHRAEYAFAEPQRVSTGVMGRQGRRNSPALIHLWQPQDTLFWDGRADSLAAQMRFSMSDPNEMNLDLTQVPAILTQAGYAGEFAAVFGRGIDLDGVAAALAAYQHTLRPEPTRFDDFLLGEREALSDSEIRGLHLFRTKARCMNCHSGTMMTDGKMHNLNQTLSGSPYQDFGRYEITGRREDWGSFKTPTLRNLSRSKPWFHHGMFVNLQGIVAIYNLGMRNPKTAESESARQIDPLIRPLDLSPQERKDLAAFLETL